MSFTHKTRVGVLRGGPSPEYDISLSTGKAILSNLPEDCEPLDIFISKDGVWHARGFEKNPFDILKTVDVAVNALHGAYGEDGKIQRLLESAGIPYTGSGPVSSALGMNKIMAKDIFRRSGLKTPHHIAVEKEEEGYISPKMLKMISENILFPVIVKPFNSGSSLGISFADNASRLKEALLASFRYSPKLIVEEFIQGKEATSGVIEDFRGCLFYTLLPVEIERNKERSFHDYDSKYVELGSKYKIPGNFTEAEKEGIRYAAIEAHKALGLRHYSRADIIVHPRRGVFVLEVNTLPELTHRSSFIKSLEAAGGGIKEFLSHLLSKALSR